MAAVPDAAPPTDVLVRWMREERAGLKLSDHEAQALAELHEESLWKEENVVRGNITYWQSRVPSRAALQRALRLRVSRGLPADSTMIALDVRRTESMRGGRRGTSSVQSIKWMSALRLPRNSPLL